MGRPKMTGWTPEFSEGFHWFRLVVRGVGTNQGVSVVSLESVGRKTDLVIWLTECSFDLQVTLRCS